MKIENENSYYETANLRAGKKLAKKYMNKALAEVPKVSAQNELGISRRFVVSEVLTFFKQKYIHAVYIYENNGGWYGDILCKRGGDSYVIGTPNREPYGCEQEAIDYVIHAMATIIAVGRGNITPVDKSDLPEEYVDFRLYQDTLTLLKERADALTRAIETMKFTISCTTEDIIKDSREVIHNEMSKPAVMRNNGEILDRVALLVGCDVYVVNYPIGWDGDPFERSSSN